MKALTESKKSLLLTASRGEYLTVQLSDKQFTDISLRDPQWQRRMAERNAEMHDLNTLFAVHRFLDFVSSDERKQQATYQITRTGLAEVMRFSKDETDAEL